MGVRTSGMWLTFTISLSSFVLVRHCVSRASEHKGYRQTPILVHILFSLVLKTFPSLVLQGRKQTKSNFYPIIAGNQRGEWLMRENMQRVSFWVCFPVCNFEGPIWWWLLPFHPLGLPYYYTVIWMQRMRRHLSKALGYTLYDDLNIHFQPY